MPQIRAMIVDGDLDSRGTAKRAVGRAGMDLAGESGYGTEAVSLAIDSQPDVIFVCVEEPVARALDTVEGLANSLPTTPVIVYSTQNNADAVRRAMVVGAREYIVKPIESSRAREAAKAALDYEARRDLQRAGLTGVRGRGTVVTVAAAKGGVGKSVLTVNLAAALSAEPGRSIVVLDADTHFGDVATMFDLSPSVTVADLTQNCGSLDRGNVRRFVTTHEPSGVDVLAASEDDEQAWDRCSLEDLKRMIDLFAQVYDFVLIDTSGGFGSFVRVCVESSTLTLVVTSDDVSSVRDTAAAVRRLERWGVQPERVRFVLNEEGSRKGVDARDLAEAIGRPISWIVPFDPAVQESVQAGEPLVLRSRRSGGARVIRSLATLIGGAQGAQSQQSFLGRMLPGRGIA